MRNATHVPRNQVVPRRPNLASVAALAANQRTLPVLSFLLILALLLWAGLLQLRTPEPVPANAAATEFSAERAMEHLRVIASEPRVTGSPGHASTQEYLLTQLRSMGLDPEVHSTTVVVPGEGGVEGFGAGAVANVVARIPGTNSTGAIAIDAHYDTGATGPGAMDAGAGVVATLETVRALQAGPPLRNDVIVVFADAEEIGMLGANAFNEQHRWASDVKLALNFEGAGGDGAAVLYATSKENDWVVSEFLSVAPDPAAYSLLPTIVHLYPDARLDCDLGEYTERGSAGLGFVSIGDTPAYHTIRDNPDLIDPGSIQQMGGYTLAAAQHFGNFDLTDIPESGNRVFFNVLPGIVVHYGSVWVIPFAILITVAIIGLVVTGVRSNTLSARGLALGAAAALLGTIGGTLLAVLIWVAIRTLNADYQVMLIGTYQSGLYTVALIFATFAAIAGMYVVLGRRTHARNLAGGALLGSLIPLWFASLVVPGMSYLVAWPLIFAALPLAWALLAGRRATSLWWRVVVLSIAVVPAMILIPGTLYAMVGFANRLEGLMGMPILGVVMLFVAPIVALLPLHLDFLNGATGWRRWAVPIAATLLAVTLIGWGNATSGYDADQPRPNRIAYELNADTGEARWISRDAHLDAWTAQFFPDGVEPTEYDSLIVGTVNAFVAEATPVATSVPEVEVVEESLSEGVRTLNLRLSADSARVIATQIIAPGEVVAVEIDGQAIDPNEFDWMADGEFPLIHQNVPPNGWYLTIAVRSTDPVTLKLEAISDDLPVLTVDEFDPRPPETMPAPDFARDPTVVTKTFEL